MVEVIKTSLECRANLCPFSLPFILYHISLTTKKPKPPISINDIIVKLTQKFPLYLTSESEKVENPALLKAEIE